MPRQRDVVEVLFRLPADGDLKQHPVIVLSNNDINEEEGGFVAVMMTSKEHYKGDDYSFELDDSMFTKPLGKPFSAIRLHLISNFMDTDVISNSNSGNQMKIEAFRRLVTLINKVAFRYTPS